MSKIYVTSLNYMRGLCMLGVIGIHVGSYALTNPQANPQLIALLEIVSRFCVPAFFFLSAFGLFLSSPLEKAFDYKEFLQKRMRTVLLPYLTWSFIYLTYTALISHNPAVFLYALPAVLYGNTAYHLYFMVILLWFYLLMPLWRMLTAYVLRAPAVTLTALFVLQVLFNYFSSYHGSAISFEIPWLQYAYEQRLNYWVAHYIWIFLLGAVFAERYQTVKELLRRHAALLTIGFSLSLVSMLGAYYYVMDKWHYTLLEAIYTIHQLSPVGMVYTAFGCVFFFYLFETVPLSMPLKQFWTILGNCSYGIYLVHPLMLYLLTPQLERWGFLYTADLVIGLYLTVLSLSLLFTFLVMNGPLPPTWRRALLGN